MRPQKRLDRVDIGCGDANLIHQCAQDSLSLFLQKRCGTGSETFTARLELLQDVEAGFAGGDLAKELFLLLA